MTAKMLEQFFDVTLIDSKPYFEFTPSILRSLVAPEHIRVIQKPHTSYLRRARFIHDVATAIGTDYVATAANQNLPYDYLLVCTGAQYTTLPGAHSSGGDGPLVLSSRAANLSSYNAVLSRAANILVVGAGTVGVELAAEIIEQFPDKQVILAGPVLPRAPPRARKHAEAWLRASGVLLMPAARVQRCEGRVFHTADGQSIQAAVAFLCTGNVPNSQLLQKSKDMAAYINERGYAVVSAHSILKRRRRKETI